MLAAGIDPQGMISFFEKIQKEDGKTTAIPAYFSTHPSPKSRIERLKIIAGETRQEDLPISCHLRCEEDPGSLRQETLILILTDH